MIYTCNTPLDLRLGKENYYTIIIWPFPIKRIDKGFQHVKNPSCDRSILVMEAVDTKAEIRATQPSDCKLLHRDHIQCTSIDDLTVRFDQASMYNINGPAHPETLEDWQGAILHLLSTFQPQRVHMFFGDLRPGMQREFTVDFRDGMTYTGLLTRNQDILYLFR